MAEEEVFGNETEAIEDNFLDELKNEEWKVEKDESPERGDSSQARDKQQRDSSVLLEERIEEEEEIIKI